MDVSSSETHARPSLSHPVDPGGFAPGTILASRYRIVSLAGRGGMGEVYRADDLKLGQPIALKFLPEALERDPAAHDRLLSEVRSARTVSHPNVCRVYDVGEVDGRAFLTMEYIDGEDLASLLRRIGKLPAAKALEVARQLCAGLAAAHDKGLLHRDLKPANVMIDGRGHARITDFGLAVPATVEGSPADVAGTLAYMAPERFRGTPATVQSDLYGLGLILYETYTGKPAFKAGTVREWERAHSDSTPTSPTALAADVEPAVERAIQRCLEKDPAKRPASAAQVAAALPGGDPLAAAIAAGETPSPELVAASGEEGTLPRWQAWTWLAACLVALAVVFAIASKVSLANLIPQQDPVILKEKAQSLLRDLGYRDPPVDAFWFMVQEPVPGEGLDADASNLIGPVHFYYRQSSKSLLRLEDSNWRGCSVPAPREIDDACVKLDARDGRLLWVRVGGVDMRPGQDGPAAPVVNWKPLLTAAGLEDVQIKPVESIQWPPAFHFDAQAAWRVSSGRYVYHADAAAYRGRATYFRLDNVTAVAVPPSTAPAGFVGRTLLSVANVVVPVVLLVLIAAFAALARHNLRQGRGDRKGAWRVAMLMLVSGAVATNLGRRWGTDPSYMYSALAVGQGGPLFSAVAAWLFYLGFEPYVRRRWPHLLVASTRLLNGRWRDPLVGRTVLIGVVAGVAFFGTSPFAALLSQLPGLGPARPFAQGGLVGLNWFVDRLLDAISGATFNCLALAGLLLTARIVLRRDGLAWTAVALVVLFNLSGESSGLSPVLGVSSAVVASVLVIAAVRTGGLLAMLVQLSVGTILWVTPLTLDVGRWYVWRSWFVVALVVGLALWGFRNVLGKQSAFPAGALDG
jgi:hypothetical protein